MGTGKKSKKELIAEIKTHLLRIEELEAVERKYRALTEKIQRLAGQVVVQNASAPAIDVPPVAETATVLVVDDNDIFRKFMREALQDNGYTVYAAESAAQALNILEDTGEKVDLMVADVVMPEGSGRELYQQVKTVYPHIKVLFVSGYTDEIIVHTDVQDVIESKVAFMQKPFHVAELLQKIEQELGKR
jgi:CheY-like chemotaxis protein